MKTKPNIKNILPQTKIDTIVHLGAGRCSELDEYLAINPRQLLLVEADPQLAEALQSRTADLQSVKVRCEAIAGRPGPATFHRYNLTDANSLHPADGLLKLFPGLKTLEQLKLEAVIPETVLKALQLDAQQENLLVIDLPGEELPVLQALEWSQQLHRFHRLQLRCGSEPLYENSEPAARILSWVQKQGFELVAEDYSRDPNRPCWTLQRNSLKLRNQELQQHVETLQAQLEQADGINEKLTKQTAGFHDQVHKLTQERDAKAKLIEDRQALIEQLTQARDNQAKLAAKRQEQVELLTKEKDKQNKLTGEMQVQVEELTSERDDQAKLAANRDTQLKKVTQTRDELTRQAGEQQKAADSQKQKLDASLKQTTELKAQVQQLTHACGNQKITATERQAKIEQLVKERDEQVKLAADRQSMVQQLTKSKNEQKEQNESQKAEINKQNALLQNEKKHSAQLEAQLAEMEIRQQLMNEEMVKAEGQIDVIKDLLLREPGL